MKFLLKAIRFSRANAHLLILFILLSFGVIPFQIIRYRGYTNGFLLMVFWIAAFIATKFFISGIYSIAWNNFTGSKLQTSSLVQESKRYFKSVIGIEIVIAVIYGIANFALVIILRKIFYPDISFADFYKSIVVIMLQQFTLFLFTLFFIYAIPFIFVTDKNAGDALSSSYKFLIRNIAVSAPVVFLWIVASTFSVVLTSFARKYGYNANEYWLITGASYVIWYVVQFIVFLVAAQILSDKYFPRNSNE